MTPIHPHSQVAGGRGATRPQQPRTPTPPTPSADVRERTPKSVPPTEELSRVSISPSKQHQTLNSEQFPEEQDAFAASTTTLQQGNTSFALNSDHHKSNTIHNNECHPSMHQDETQSSTLSQERHHNSFHTDQAIGETVDATAAATKAAMLEQLKAQAAQFGLCLADSESSHQKDPPAQAKKEQEDWKEIEKKIEDALHTALDSIYDFDSPHPKGTAQKTLNTLSGEPFYNSEDWQDILRETTQELFEKSILPEGYDESNIDKQYITDIATAELERFIYDPDVLSMMGKDKETDGEERESMEVDNSKVSAGADDEEDDDEGSDDDEPTIEGYLTARQIVEEGHEEKPIEYILVLKAISKILQDMGRPPFPTNGFAFRSAEYGPFYFYSDYDHLVDLATEHPTAEIGEPWCI